MSKWLNGVRTEPVIRGSLESLTRSLAERIEIIEWILESAHGEVGLTERKIMHTFSLSSIEADRYLSTLIRNELLTYDIRTDAYKATQKGHDILECMRQMYELDELSD